MVCCAMPTCGESIMGGIVDVKVGCTVGFFMEDLCMGDGIAMIKGLVRE